MIRILSSDSVGRLLSRRKGKGGKSPEQEDAERKSLVHHVSLPFLGS